MKFSFSSEILCDFQPPQSSSARVDSGVSHVSTIFSVLRINKTIFYALLCVCDVDFPFCAILFSSSSRKSSFSTPTLSKVLAHAHTASHRVWGLHSCSSAEKMKQKIYSAGEQKIFISSSLFGFFLMLSKRFQLSPTLSLLGTIFDSCRKSVLLAKNKFFFL